MSRIHKIRGVAILIVVNVAVISSFVTASKYSLMAGTAEATQVPTVVKAKQILHIDALDKNFGPVKWVGWRPGHTELAVIYEEDAAIRILDADTGQLKLTLPPVAAADTITAVQWSPDGRFFACNSLNPVDAIYIWDLSHDMLTDPFVLHHTGYQTSLSWNPNNQQLISVGAFGQFQDRWKLFVWDITKDTPITEVDTTLDPIVKVSLSHDGKTLATLTRGGVDATENFNLQLRDTSSFKVLKSLPKSIPSPIMRHFENQRAGECRRGRINVAQAAK